MNSMRVRIAHLRWQGRARLNHWMDWLVTYMPTWVLNLLLGDNRAVVLSSEAGELHAELRSFVTGGRSLQRAVLHNDQWVPERAWKALRQAERTCPVILILPQALTLAREIRVPLMALENLEGTIRHGFKAWTPFSHEEVHISACLRMMAGNQVIVDLRYALRDQVRELLNTFSEAGLRADRVSLNGEIAGATIIDTVKRQRRRRQHVTDGVLLALALALALVSVLQVWRRQDTAITDRRDSIPYETSQVQQPVRGKAPSMTLRRSVLIILNAFSAALLIWTVQFYEPLSNHPVIRLPPPPEVPDQPNEPAPVTTAAATIQQDDRLRLIGVMLAPDQRSAWVQQGDRALRRIMLGDNLDGGRVTEISRRSITIDLAGTRRDLLLDPPAEPR